MTNYPLEQIDEFRFRIPKHGKMQVDGIIFANATLMEAIQNDQSLQQVINVATLPGIASPSLAMPDIHWGYGFPIGGVAAFDAQEGVVSPGGVGYDINCLHKYSELLDFFGCRRKIESFKDLRSPPKLLCFAEGEGLKAVPIQAFLERSSDGNLIRVTTESGKILFATPEHPILGSHGMVPIGKIGMGDELAIYHFEGVPYTTPTNDTIISEREMITSLHNLGKQGAGNAIPQILKFLRKIELLPLRYDSPAWPHLIRVIGFLLGDGTLYIESSRKRPKTAFYGKKEDLEKIRDDIRTIGFTPSPIHTRHRQHSIKTGYKRYRFEHQECSFYVSSSGFGALMLALGVPLGKRVAVPYEVPPWIHRAPLWQKRLFLAALFGAELNTPKTLTGHGYTFYCPTLDMNKRADLAENGRTFLMQISELLSEFGVETRKISSRSEFTNPKGEESLRFRLILSEQHESLVNLYEKIGFEYNHKRQVRAAQAVAYLKYKERHLEWRQNIADNIQTYAQMTGTDAQGVYSRFGSWAPNRQFVERSITGRKSRVRVGNSFPTFEEFIRDSTEGLEESGCVWERVIAVGEEPYHGPVYDFTVGHPAHNFITDGFVVSNCGVRVARTQLEYGDVKPKLKELVEALFREIPAGVGSHRKKKLSIEEEKKMLVKGAGWAVEQGYGEPEDLEYIESKGCIPNADPAAVSPTALDRGRGQIGTVGSGNHFIEIEYIDEIYDETVTAALGIHKNQIAVSIHSGSRGLGHQVCDDYLDIMLKAAHQYGIELVDRQLCCAPLTSPEAKRYLAAMACAANFAFTNRQLMLHNCREVFMRFFGMGPNDLGMDLIYDVAHNIAKFEKHTIGGQEKWVCVHRKGATRAYPPGHPETPAAYQKIGQPVLIPGDMGRYSFILVGTEQAYHETFGSSCHGAGRRLSRHAAKRQSRGRRIYEEFEQKGIILRSQSLAGVLEEIPEAYKDVADVVDVVAGAGIAKKVARLRPIGVIKG